MRWPGCASPSRVAGAAFRPPEGELWGSQARAVDFFDVKADLEAISAPRRLRFEAAAHPALHPGRSARLLIEGPAGNAPAGWLGELHPRWQQKYELPQPVVLFELEADCLTQMPLPRPSQPSRFPSVVRDIALLVDAGVPAQAFLDAVQAEKPSVVQRVWMFDLYQGQNLPAGKKSLAFRVVMQDTERTLTDAEADSARDCRGRAVGSAFWRQIASIIKKP